jgi:hypothetical protein
LEVTKTWINHSNEKTVIRLTFECVMCPQKSPCWFPQGGLLMFIVSLFKYFINFFKKKKLGVCLCCGFHQLTSFYDCNLWCMLIFINLVGEVFYDKISCTCVILERKTKTEKNTGEKICLSIHSLVHSCCFWEMTVGRDYDWGLCC